MAVFDANTLVECGRCDVVDGAAVAAFNAELAQHGALADLTWKWCDDTPSFMLIIQTLGPQLRHVYVSAPDAFVSLFGWWNISSGHVRSLLTV